MPGSSLSRPAHVEDVGVVGRGTRLGGPVQRGPLGDGRHRVVSTVLCIERGSDTLINRQELYESAWFGSAARRQLAFYGSRLRVVALALLETVPRAPRDEQLARVRASVAPERVAVLDGTARRPSRAPGGRRGSPP